MKLVPVKKSDIPSGRAKSSKYKELLEEFVESGNEAAKISDAPARIASAATQLRRYIKMGKLPVSVRVSGKDIYLVKGSG